ncbi:MAG: TIGR01906 family membrane protein [Caldisericia bacterium]
MRKVFLIILIPLLLIFSFSIIIGFSKNYYLYEFNRIKPELKLNVDPKFIRYAAQVIPEYLSGKRDNLDIPGFKNFFNEKETKHMEDVRNIFKYVILLTIFIGIIIFLLINKKDLPNIFLFSFIPIILFLILYLFIPFDELFTNFHLILFKNDLWLLDPNIDRLIVLLPEDFFIRALQKILIFTSVALIFLYSIFKILEVNFEKRDK